MTGLADLIAPLKQMRLKHGLTQAQVATAMGVSEPLVSMIENGRRMRVDTLIRYADAVGGELAVIRRRDRRELGA